MKVLQYVSGFLFLEIPILLRKDMIIILRPEIYDDAKPYVPPTLVQEQFRQSALALNKSTI